MAHGTGHATGLIVNVLTLKTMSEATDAWFLRNGLGAHRLAWFSDSLLTECGLQVQSRQDRFQGLSLALLDTQLLVGMDVPSPIMGCLEFGPSA